MTDDPAVIGRQWPMPGRFFGCCAIAVAALLIQRRLILIPPALTLVGLAAAGSLFGFGGIVFAGPIVAILYVGVRKLYLGISVDDRSTHGDRPQLQSGVVSDAAAPSR